jgi:hypothetical protein
MIAIPGTPSTEPAANTAAWQVSAADIDALDARIVTDDPGARANSPCACASLPATTSAWLDGLLSTHSARRR